MNIIGSFALTEIHV